MNDPDEPLEAIAIVELLRKRGLLHSPRAVPPDPERDALLDRFFAATTEVYADHATAALRAQRDEFFDGTRDPYAEIIAALTKELIEQLHPPELRDRLADPRRFAVAVEELFDPNARSFATGGAWLVLIDRSLISALYVCARSIAARVNLPADAPACESCGDRACATPSAAVTARRWFESGWRAHRRSRYPAELWMPAGPGLAYANALASSAEAFVLAHEIAHHAAGHTAAPANFRVLSPDAEAVEFLPTHAMEFEADVGGAQLLAVTALRTAPTDAAGVTDRSGLVRVALGAEHFFTSAELWLRTAPRPPQQPRTHPPLDQRRLAVQSLWANSPQFEPLETVAEDLRAFYRGLWRTLAEPTEHDHRAWRRERQELASLVEAAFAAVSDQGHDHFATVVPDLNRLRSASSQLLFDSVVADQCAPSAACPQAAAAYLQLFCDTPADLADQVDPGAPFLGLAGHVDHLTPFAQVAR